MLLNYRETPTWTKAYYIYSVVSELLAFPFSFVDVSQSSKATSDAKMAWRLGFVKTCRQIYSSRFDHGTTAPKTMFRSGRVSHFAVWCQIYATFLSRSGSSVLRALLPPWWTYRMSDAAHF